MIHHSALSLFDVSSILAAIIILVTAVARLNDIKSAQKSVTWWVRRAGLLMLVVAMAMVIAAHFMVPVPYWYQTMWLCFIWGLALTWLTTPGMPPWHKYVFRNMKDE